MKSWQQNCTRRSPGVRESEKAENDGLDSKIQWQTQKELGGLERQGSAISQLCNSLSIPTTRAVTS